MFVERKAIALPESAVQISQLSTVPSIFILEFDRVYPGFGLVRCLKCDQNNDILYKSLEWRGRDKYVSSKSVRETFAVTKSSFVHGPCQTSRFHGIEMDQVYALKCPIWPTQAQSFIKKSLDRGWPSKDILTEICTDGCLLIPINSKQQQCSDSTDLEWRISFSLAEKRLIFSMNHCQLLCYGLLKLFLNEVLKEIPTINDLLCSYFMKTAVFWEISENTNAWLPVNFLSSFWNAFRRLISWVHVGYCPNFFIPENNMFFGKICGKKQKMLLKTLGDLYREGYFSLLQCSSLNKTFSMIINNLDFTISHRNNETEVEEQKFQQILSFMPEEEVHEIHETMQYLENTSLLNVQTPEMMYALTFRVNSLVQSLAESFFIPQKSLYHAYTPNRVLYQYIKAGQRMLLKTNTFAFMDKFIYAKHIYGSGNYYKAIRLLSFLKTQLQEQPKMNYWNTSEEMIASIKEQGIRYDMLIKTLIMGNPCTKRYSEIEELNLEIHFSSDTEGLSIIYIPPLVFIIFLMFLSYQRLEEDEQVSTILSKLHRQQRQKDLASELYALLCHDDAFHIRGTEKAISWHILGICQQLLNNKQGAKESYTKALNDEYTYFRQAAEIRIDSLKSDDSDSDSIPTVYYE
ncbi:hypothetical protein FSP39_022406 [Pinctada imbricata]|uniref:Mab-21-like HhH/H2TH-like domain-containing protein n=1 Tax=Pinctada imbricata TaxID=66713 RepID=A0AA89BTH1_PINIB|nr:hypothetical protein FSP39_022406 [Pinctada imbricata]